MKEKYFLWRLDWDIPFELEESFSWKLETIGINSFSFERRPDQSEFSKISIWCSFSDWSRKEIDQLIVGLDSLAETFDKNLPRPKCVKQTQEDWSLTWKKDWQPDAIGENLLILPEWLSVPDVFSDRKIVRIDPGSAFGTGSHPTTRLCLESLEIAAPKDLQVADIGCGSGILGLTALAFGAQKVFSVDTDSLAISATRRNSQLNDYAKDSIVFWKGSIDVLHLNLQEKSINLLMCNIIAPVIETLIPGFDQLLSLNGKALLSGILIDQVEGLSDLLRNYGWKVFRSCEKNNWVLLEIHRY